MDHQATKVKRRVQYLLLLLVMVLTCGCAAVSDEVASDSSNVGSLEDNVYREEASSDEPPADDISEEPALAPNEFLIEDIMVNQVPGVYLQKGGSETAYLLQGIPQVVYSLESDESGVSFDVYSGYTSDCGSGDDEDWGPYTIDRESGDRILVVGTPLFDQFGAQTVKEWGFWTSEDNVSVVSLDEIEGQPFETAEEGEEILLSYGLKSSPYASRIASDGSSPAQFRWGQYQGTNFAEGTMIVDEPYYCALNYDYYWHEDYEKPYNMGNGFDCPLERTKDGFFIVDLSGLESGVFIMKEYLDETETDYSHYPINLL